MIPPVGTRAAAMLAAGPSSPAKANESQMNTELKRRPFSAALVLGALGVVYGDIGTSPLYALRE